MKKQLILVTVFSLIIFGFGSLNSALAGVVNQPIDITSLGDEVGASLMASSDLGIDNVGTLPTSFFYFFKEWSRGIQRFFTFNSVAKAELELNITNQIAAELLEVNKAKPDDVGALKKVLENYTKAQERLNMRIGKLPAISNPNVAKLLEDVDEKTAKHVELLEQVARNITTGTGTIVNDDTDVSKILKNAQDNTLKTFTITVTSVNDAPSLKQKAEEQIKLAGIAVVTVDVVSPTGGESNIFDRWGNLIAKAKGRLDSAKKAFADGKYGEAYGQARSAEAIVSVLATGSNFPDKKVDETAPTGESTGSPKTPESPKVSPTLDNANTPSPASAGNPAGAR